MSIFIENILADPTRWPALVLLGGGALLMVAGYVWSQLDDKRGPTHLDGNNGPAIVAIGALLMVLGIACAVIRMRMGR